MKRPYGCSRSAGSADPKLAVIVLSSTDDPTLIDAAFERGASAYVLKTSEPDVIATAIRQAFEPSLYFARPNEKRPVTATVELLEPKLTRRELEILKLVSEGRSNRQVAELLWVTDQTVKFHLANVYRKLGVRSRFDAARWALEHGVLDAAAEEAVAHAATRTGTGTATGTATGRRPTSSRCAGPQPAAALGGGSREHRDDAHRELPSPGTAAADRRGVPAGSDLQREAEQVLHGGSGKDQLAGGRERKRAVGDTRRRRAGARNVPCRP